MKKVRIKNKIVGECHQCFIIAEAGSNHDGSLKQAKKLIKIAANSGVDAVKFQAFKAEKLHQNPARIKSLQALEVSPEWYDELFAYANNLNVALFFSIFDEKSVDLLNRYDVPAYKIASYELIHYPLLEHVARYGKPIIISTGIASYNEVKKAIEHITAQGNYQIILLHCLSQYPALDEDINLKSISALEEFDFPVGFSDHTNGILAAQLAVAAGAKVIEKHFTLDRSMKGPDHSFAIEPEELKKMVQSIRKTEKMMGEKKIMALKAEINQLESRRAIYANKNIPKGTVLKKDDLIVLRPSPPGSLPPEFFEVLIGKKTLKDLKKDEIILKNMYR
jgi:N-acetylneuraminate synthase/N,N'-diacetyllegionaminate synthase